MLYKYPSEQDSCKDFVVSLRSFLSLKRSLKLQEGVPRHLNVDGTCSQTNEIDISIFNQFIEHVVFNTIRLPTVPLPQNIDEIMQDSLNTCF